ncbi:hypothetical protein, partial [Bradyrhizobium brasilense]|uniref:hypothetical protein n=1 Tax=Bradyrhizobium brasilense TaxID=1419277 RepID=UPI0019D385DB
PETKQPERLAPRATSNRNGGRDHLGILGEIKSVHPGEIIGIRTGNPDLCSRGRYGVRCLRGTRNVRQPASFYCVSGFKRMPRPVAITLMSLAVATLTAFGIAAALMIH